MGRGADRNEVKGWNVTTGFNSLEGISRDSLWLVVVCDLICVALGLLPTGEAMNYSFWQRLGWECGNGLEWTGLGEDERSFSSAVSGILRGKEGSDPRIQSSGSHPGSWPPCLVEERNWLHISWLHSPKLPISANRVAIFL